MHYHYFTLEQRDALASQICAHMAGRQGERQNDALAALRSPGYGVCEACQADIPFVYLLEDPLARLCHRCRRASR